VEGTIVGGRKLGRTLGYPTANIAPDPSCRLKHGIYAVTISIDDQTRGGVASFGQRPTFDNGAPLLEVHILNFDGDLYGKMAEVAFVDFIRAEEKFRNPELLVEQMHKDAADAQKILA
jgi:riboflavin kinase/FMN adenylyltransferase